MPKRIQRQRTKGWRMPDGAVYVGRGSRYGNPFTLGGPNGLACVPGAVTGADWEYEDRISTAGMRHDFFHGGGRVTPCEVRNLSRTEAVSLYREVLTKDVVHIRDPRWIRVGPRDNPVTIEGLRRELAGRDLACWCPLSSPCHADILLELANTAEGDDR
ncbi:DUF4326 domain-containing protein [Rhodococcus hoagii]|nr:DUF4326 domain-containing protein [Prescottella equi]NKS72190.1 DUF4326 domain-containing protein [Prescottella equi]